MLNWCCLSNIGWGKMINSKLEGVTEAVLSYMEMEDYKNGDRLPAERKLAGLLSTSRNTVREALQVLQERNIVEIRRSSGCYLKSLPGDSAGEESNAGKESRDIVTSQLEARYMIEPEVAELAMSRISEDDIVKLENVIVGLSQAIIRRDYSDIISQDKLFRRTLAQATGNAVLVMTVRQLETNTHHTWKMLSGLPEEALNTVFANYVKTLNAIQARDIPDVKQLVKEIILTMCRLFSESSNLDFSGILCKEKEIGGEGS